MRSIIKQSFSICLMLIIASQMSLANPSTIDFFESVNIIALSLDSNGNDVLDEAETLEAIEYWAMEKPVPGTTEIISDTKVLELVKKWILSSSVRQPDSIQGVKPLAVNDIRVVALSPLLHEVWLSGQSIATTEVQIYDLQGHLLINRQQLGRALNFQLANNTGRPLANGTYLMMVSATGLSGERWQGNLQKILVFR